MKYFWLHQFNQRTKEYDIPIVYMLFTPSHKSRTNLRNLCSAICDRVKLWEDGLQIQFHIDPVLYGFSVIYSESTIDSYSLYLDPSRIRLIVQTVGADGYNHDCQMLLMESLTWEEAGFTESPWDIS